MQKKMPRHHDAAPSEYQNNVSNTNYSVDISFYIIPLLT